MNQAPILVQKFGGTSVSTAERRLQAVEHVRRARAEGYRVAIVVSAMGRRGDPYATDTLLDLLRCDGLPVDGRDYDLIFGCGEIVSAVMMAHLLKREGIPAAGLTGGQAGIYTDGNYCEAEIVEIDPARIRHYLDEGAVPVIAGCQGIVPHTGDVTTLGRGGSDTSSVAVGVALGAALVEIYQNCNIFNDGAWEPLKDSDVRDDNLIRLQHGEPIRFGADGWAYNCEKGLREKDETLRCGFSLWGGDMNLRGKTCRITQACLSNFCNENDMLSSASARIKWRVRNVLGRFLAAARLVL